jgi:hypothetical protein
MDLIPPNPEDHPGQYRIDFCKGGSKCQPGGVPHKSFKIMLGMVLIHAGKILGRVSNPSSEIELN